MADPAAATITQLKNIQARTGKTIAELHAAVAAGDAAKHGERRSWLMEHFKLGYGDANAVALFIGKPLPDLGGGASTAAAPSAASGDPLAAVYTGAKAGLRPLHEAVMSQIRAFGDFEATPKTRRMLGANRAWEGPEEHGRSISLHNIHSNALKRQRGEASRCALRTCAKRSQSWINAVSSLSSASTA